MVTREPNNDPIDPRDRVVDEKARDAAKVATIIAVVAGLIAVAALLFAFLHNHHSAPENCNPETDYVCEPEIVEETSTVDVPTTSMSPTSTEVPVPSTTRSEIVTTTVRP